MAPMRSHIFDQFKRSKQDRKVSSGTVLEATGRRSTLTTSTRFRRSSTTSRVILRCRMFRGRPVGKPGVGRRKTLGGKEGYTGFIHQVLLDNYLNDHPSLEDCEYYLCGPPMMNTAVINMLLELGVEPEISF